MTSSAEKIGSALGKAVKSTVAKWKEGESAPVMYRTNLRDVPKVEGLKRDDGWVDMQVQFLIDKKTAGADHVVGWTVLKPGARHEKTIDGLPAHVPAIARGVAPEIAEVRHALECDAPFAGA